MLLHIPEVLSSKQSQEMLRLLTAADWIDGRVTAGNQSAQVKYNMQIPEDHPTAQNMGSVILGELQQNALFVSAALPQRVFPPLFSRYAPGQSFGTHIDNAIRQFPGSGLRIRTDLAATLFLSDPESYDGGELTVEDTYGVHTVKLPAGHLILYPASSLHYVRPVTRGVRYVSFFWIQSMVRDDGGRSLLFDLDNAIQQVRVALPDHPASVQLTGVYHNLVRRWADT